MAANVISAALHLCISGHIDPPTPVMLSNICSVVVNETQRKLSILPERIDLYEKGLVSFCWVIPSLAHTAQRTCSPMGQAPMLLFYRML